ncbi:hypothetical protein EYF80_013238 [Liparis tanakae]|uniref:Uncharacterized protein n=1 Tax=Liparis tanakae TaxID=230148 RepID=A0A4Z2IF34_9TELE|nr:hypothetical protein EYF80_013238 [Liparis tanakae]
MVNTLQCPGPKGAGGGQVRLLLLLAVFTHTARWWQADTNVKAPMQELNLRVGQSAWDWALLGLSLESSAPPAAFSSHQNSNCRSKAGEAGSGRSVVGWLLPKAPLESELKEFLKEPFLIDRLRYSSARRFRILMISSPQNPSPHQRQKPAATDLCYKTEISSLMDFNSPDASLDKGTGSDITGWVKLGMWAGSEKRVSAKKSNRAPEKEERKSVKGTVLRRMRREIA